MNLFSTALAEEATAAASQSSSFSIIDLVFLGIGIYYFVCGILTIAKKKIYDGTAKSYAKYTDESVQRAIPFIGVMDFFIGLGFALSGAAELNLIPSITNGSTAKWIIIGIAVVIALIVGCYMQFRILKKKPTENQ